jgi:proteasome assembly chaperone (PAC2) family protein
MKEALAGLFGSKKALAAMAGSVTSALILLASKHGYGLDPAAAAVLVKAVLGFVGLYIVGQGAADWGKEKEKLVQAATAVVSSAEKLPEASEPEVLTEDA